MLSKKLKTLKLKNESCDNISKTEKQYSIGDNKRRRIKKEINDKNKIEPLNYYKNMKKIKKENNDKNKNDKDDIYFNKLN